jgi:hypothetical protein
MCPKNEKMYVNKQKPRSLIVPVQHICTVKNRVIYVGVLIPKEQKPFTLGMKFAPVGELCPPGAKLSQIVVKILCSPLHTPRGQSLPSGAKFIKVHPQVQTSRCEHKKSLFCAKVSHNA